MTPSLFPSAEVTLWGFFCAFSSSQAPESFNLSLLSGPMTLPAAMAVQLEHHTHLKPVTPVVPREDKAKHFDRIETNHFMTLLVQTD